MKQDESSRSKDPRKRKNNNCSYHVLQNNNAWYVLAEHCCPGAVRWYRKVPGYMLRYGAFRTVLRTVLQNVSAVGSRPGLGTLGRCFKLHP